MTDNIDKFSETRWPVPLDPDVPNGDNRKALSRYITSYLSELRKTDPDLFNESENINSDPTLTLEELEEESDSGISLQDYLKEQNRVFQKVGGYKSYTQLSQAETQEDQSNVALCKSLEIYLAALDEKSYVNVCNTRISLGMRDAEVKSSVEALEEAFGPDFTITEPEARRKLLKIVISLRKQMQVLWTKHTFLCQQRDQVEIDLGILRNDHALQLAKVFRLQYATQCLGKKLIEANEARKRSLELEKTVQKQEQEITDLHAENEALKAALLASNSVSSVNSANAVSNTSKPDTASTEAGKTNTSTETAQKSTEVGAAPAETAQKGAASPDQETVVSKGASGTSTSTSTSNSTSTSSGAVQNTAFSVPDSKPTPNSLEEEHPVMNNEYLNHLYTEVSRLKASEEWISSHENGDIESQDISTLLANLITLIELNQTSNSQKQVQLARAFLKQYHARESELLTSIKVLQSEKRIILARCEKYVRKCRQMELDLDYAEKRSLSMVLMLKNMKVFLE